MSSTPCQEFDGRVIWKSPKKLVFTIVLVVIGGLFLLPWIMPFWGPLLDNRLRLSLTVAAAIPLSVGLVSLLSVDELEFDLNARRYRRVWGANFAPKIREGDLDEIEAFEVTTKVVTSDESSVTYVIVQALWPEKRVKKFELFSVPENYFYSPEGAWVSKRKSPAGSMSSHEYARRKAEELSQRFQIKVDDKLEKSELRR